MAYEDYFTALYLAVYCLRNSVMYIFGQFSLSILIIRIANIEFNQRILDCLYTTRHCFRDLLKFE